MPLYRHTQVGYGILIITAVVWLIELTVSWGQPLAVPVDLAVSLLLFAIGFVFATMTITVTSDRVEWCLTKGLFRQTRLRSSITNVSVIKISLLNGLGIRTNNFRDYLWSIGGSSAIRFDLEGGRKLALSTDDPEGLLRALQSISTGT